MCTLLDLCVICEPPRRGCGRSTLTPLNGARFRNLSELRTSQNLKPPAPRQGHVLREDAFRGVEVRGSEVPRGPPEELGDAGKAHREAIATAQKSKYEFSRRIARRLTAKWP